MNERLQGGNIVKRYLVTRMKLESSDKCFSSKEKLAKFLLAKYLILESKMMPTAD